jgi:hypothetical protein
MRLISLVIASVVILSSGAALAASNEDPKPTSVEEMNFEADVLTVDYLKPNLEFLGMLRPEKMASLIHIRKDFDEEIVRSAEDL